MAKFAPEMPFAPKNSGSTPVFWVFFAVCPCFTLISSDSPSDFSGIPGCAFLTLRVNPSSNFANNPGLPFFWAFLVHGTGKSPEILSGRKSLSPGACMGVDICINPGLLINLKMIGKPVPEILGNNANSG
jgi:hypothetical protein